MGEDSLRRARFVSSIAATVISLACGTNYVYSAWAPQFAEKLKLSSTESNLIGLSGNLGMYSLGIPVGIFIDTRGPRPAVLFGSLLLALGYFPLRQAYIRGHDSLILMCLYSFASGLGGCAAFAAAIKTSALNWPHHRGTATAFPLAAFGLSAFFFSVFSRFVFPGDPGNFLLLLAIGCCGMTFVSFFFLQVMPHSAYSLLSTGDGLSRVDSNPLRRRVSEENKRSPRRGVVGEPGESSPINQAHPNAEHTLNLPDIEAEAAPAPGLVAETNETSSLMSRDSSEDSGEHAEDGTSVDKDLANHLDIRGLKMIPLPEFWFLFALMGILTGVGLMTINNIGNDATALWRAFDPERSPEFIAKRQSIHVAILSVCSFVGRLCSGVGSDLIVKRLHASRMWCLTLSAVLFLVAQLCALNISNPNFLFTVSSFTGLAYGFLFGVFPSIVAETFGVHGLSQNWGCMTLAPVVSGNLFNIFYGLVFDAHSRIDDEGGHMVCDQGLTCYRNAYVVTIVSCVAGLVVTLWSIRHTHTKKTRDAKAVERLA